MYLCISEVQYEPIHYNESDFPKLNMRLIGDILGELTRLLVAIGDILGELTRLLVAITNVILYSIRFNEQYLLHNLILSYFFSKL